MDIEAWWILREKQITWYSVARINSGIAQLIAKTPAVIGNIRSKASFLQNGIAYRDHATKAHSIADIIHCTKARKAIISTLSDERCGPPPPPQSATPPSQKADGTKVWRLLIQRSDPSPIAYLQCHVLDISKNASVWGDAKAGRAVRRPDGHIRTASRSPSRTPCTRTSCCRCAPRRGPACSRGTRPPRGRTRACP